MATQGMEAACAAGGHVWQLVRIDVHDWDRHQLGVEQVCARCGDIRYGAIGREPLMGPGP